MCIFNCGNEARYELKNGDPCCSQKHHQCPGWRKKISDNLKSYYKDPKFYDHMCEVSKDVHNRPEVIQKKHDKMVALHNDPKNLDFQIRYKKGKANVSGEKHYRWSNGGGYVYWHIKARKLYLKDHCERCGVTLNQLKMQRPNGKVFFHIHCVSEDFRNLASVNWETLCPDCHQVIQKRMRELNEGEK